MITDRHHLVRIAEDGIEALEAVAKAWLREDDHACSPKASSGPPISGGGTSDPTQNVALRDDRYRDRDEIGRFLYEIVQSLVAEKERREPRKAEKVSRCVNCNEGLGTRTDGRCSFCGPWHSRQGADRDPEQAKSYWFNTFETRPCRKCDEPIKVSEGRRTCDRCRKAA